MPGTWFVMIPPGYASKSDAEKELVDFRISYPYPSQAWTDANAGRIVQGAEGETGNPQVSEQLVRWQGPFSTEAQAKAAQNPQQQSPNPLNDAANAAQNSDSLGGLTDFLSRLTSGNTWLRVAEVLLGGGLIIVALAKLASGTAAGQAAKKAGKAALIL